MCETTSGANCQQLTAIRDASYICDAVFPQLQPLLKVNLDLCARRTIFSCFHLLLEKVYFIIYLPESSETDRESTQLAVCDQLKIKRTKLGTGCSVLTLSEWVNCHFKIWTQRVTFMARDASYIWSKRQKESLILWCQGSFALLRMFLAQQGGAAFWERYSGKVFALFIFLYCR